jgi:hypothetical protein
MPIHHPYFCKSFRFSEPWWRVMDGDGFLLLSATRARTRA